MNRERYNRLVNIFLERKYIVDLKSLNVISKWDKKKKNKSLDYYLTNQGRKRYRLSYNGVRYEYELQEIITVWMGKPCIDMICVFLDGNKLNCHPSNLYWTEKRGSRPDLAGEKSSNCKLTKKEVSEIRRYKIIRGKKNYSELEELATKYKVAKSTIINIRQGKGWGKISISKNNRVF